MRKVLNRRSESTPPTRDERCHACDVPLEEVLAGDHSLLRCPSCQGSWLGAAALAATLCRQNPTEDLLKIAEAEGEADIAHTFAPSRLKRACPVCAATMQNDRFEDSGVWIDSCPEGHGIWLDSGELKLLREWRMHPRPAANQLDLEDHLEDTVSDLMLSFL
jgi:Zn-finger nucleic acid-binding protein